jgi:hypothetical protein
VRLLSGQSIALGGGLAALLALGVAGCGGTQSCETRGTICLVAGTGVRGFNGDGLAATKSDLYLVSSVRRSPDGVVHVMDFNNHRLRIIQDDGTMTTIAGDGDHNYAVMGPALASPLENPIDFDFLPGGKIVFVSLHDPRVIELGTDGILRTLAGTGDLGDDGDGGPALMAHFTELLGVLVAPDGRIFISDGSAHRVRIVHPGGVVETFAGRGIKGYEGDGGPATKAVLNRPSGMALDGDGRLYFAEVGNHIIRRVNVDGTIETVVGMGTAGFSGDGGPATAAELAFPSGVAIDTDGSIYIADSFNNRLRRVDPAGIITTIAGTGVTDYKGDGGPATNAALQGPSGIAIDGDDLLVADQVSSRARRVRLR